MIKPNEYKKNVLEINYSKLENEGKKLLCFDVDNTLDHPDVLTEELLDMTKELFSKLENYNFEVLLVSNNTIPTRVEKFAKLVEKDYIDSMKKPFQRNYKKSQVIQSFHEDEVVFIGDKLITDVIGGNLYGGHTILVDPIKEKGDKIHQKFMKYSDRLFCKAIKFKRGEYY